MKLAKVIWENCWSADGSSYDLCKVARHTGCKVSESMEMYLSLVEAIRPIASRQAAAIAVATALALYRDKEPIIERRDDISER